MAVYLRLAEFTGFSPAIHQNAMECGEAASAMKQNIVIPIPIERVKICIRWTLEAATWLITLGLMAAALVTAMDVYLTRNLPKESRP